MKHILAKGTLVVFATFALYLFPAQVFANTPEFLTENLKLGSTGEQVTLLQTWLSKDKTIFPEQVVNGTYGPGTERAVKRYQEKKGMILRNSWSGGSYGAVGPMTRANLNADFSQTQGGTATVEALYGDAQVFDGKKFTALSETEYLANKPVMARINLWIYPFSLPPRETALFTNGTGHVVGFFDGGKLYADGPKGKAVTRLPYVASGEWQHVSVLFTADDAVFIFNNKVVETVPLTQPEPFFFSSFLNSLVSPFKFFSFGSAESKPFSFGGAGEVTMPRAHSGIFDGIVSFMQGIFGVAPEESAPVATEPVIKPELPATPNASEEKPLPVAVAPTLPKPKPQPITLPIFEPATTTIVTPVSSTTPPTPTFISTTTVLALTGTTTPITATSTASTTGPASPSVSFGGGSVSTAPTNAAPVITLSGSASLSIPTGSIYTDPGVTATDTEDGSLTSSVVATGTVNHLLPATYTITYNVSDSKGLAAAAVTRTVTVTPPTPLSPESQVTTYPLTPAGQEVSFTISSGAGQNPTFASVDINPLHVYVGDTQTMTVIVESPGGVASVQAVTQLDTTTLTLNFVKTVDNGDRATFAASWVVYDTHVRTYRTTFTATANSGATNSTTMAWSDPCSNVIQGTNSTLGADCTVSAVDGLDGGTLTIPNGRTLTINSGGTWGFNPGTSVVVDGVLSKGTGGQIRKGYLFYAGTTNANADATTKFFFTDTPQTGYVRVNQYAQSSYQSYYELKYCLAGDTGILMADGSVKDIKDVRLGDMVMGRSEDGTMRRNIVTKTFDHGPQENEYQPFSTLIINGKVTATAEHPFLTARGIVTAGELRIDDTLITLSGKEHVTSIIEGPRLPSVYNLEVFPDHTYFANGILVHNKSQCTLC